MSAAAELRILTGRHAGARAPLAGGERMGADDGCDLILTDLDLPSDMGAWVQIAMGRWWVRSSPPEAQAPADAPPADPASSWVSEQPWGAVAYLGQVAITVSAADAAWQAVPHGHVEAAGAAATADKTAADTTLTAASAGSPTQASRTGDPVLAVIPQNDAADPQHGHNPASEPGGRAVDATVRTGAGVAAGSAPAKARRRWQPALIIGLALAALLLSVFWSLLKGQGAQRAAEGAQASEANAAAAGAERQQRLLRDIQLAIARVDPGLRLRIEALPTGGARVSGWVADIAQLDRLAEGLAGIRPAPALAVRTASDLMDDLVEAGGPDAQALRFELLGEGRVRAHGLVMAPAERDRVLALVRARVPPGIEIVDGLRVASAQGGTVQEWLRTAGFAGAEARWDGEQMVIGLDIGGQERARLESLLARAATPLSGIPFVLRTREVGRAPAVAAVPAVPAHASKAPLPFSIRSVVGGAVPYIVLGDGSKLQPGGRRAGWRLVAVESDRIVFDGPRSLVVMR
ncbi:hypothetical protein ASF11_24810 [Acidovorax sp. Leaf76]|uniref:hypothetical protein n=1 Tax=unclassified Acidovorax TaxID=2684926 RepID=UPI0006FDC4E9|nr:MULTISPECIES: hypothetical protein [unclassified Acidovorax]KQO20783.1 hypothetical protein ASF11_24810 [Acidovorax sp. Leaf76]KQO34046.1 hypothetical protein ASF19_24625 [Acidovorax sp. Leaf84]KQS36666.1 hypothetical protein ASG27_24895 [Acidovorax sp. Leaf191]